MINCIKNTYLYKSLELEKTNFHAYLFYSTDKELNNNVALTFAKTLLCENKNACGNCNACKQFESHSHPDVTIVNQDQIKVEDANLIINKLNTKPISSSYKIFVILNAENMNETAQNKLLKSFEEPNQSDIFILSSSKTDKLLSTILSRLNKIYIPKLSVDDLKIISKELLEKNIDISKYLNSQFSLTEIINFVSNPNYIKTLSAINFMLSNLNSSQDIPYVASNIVDIEKNLFFPIMEDLFLDCLKNTNKFDNSIKQTIKNKFNNKVLIKCLPLIEDAYKKQMFNVNFNYILDNLLFNILKEKFLCK